MIKIDRNGLKKEDFFMKIAVSACLLGENCKYNGGNNFSSELAAFFAGHEVVPLCPEALVFPTPRPKIERRGDRVINEFGLDVTEDCVAGVSACVESLRGQQIDLVILKYRSPTCGVREIYDGTFSGVRIAGSGVLAEALLREGYRVTDEEALWNEMP